MAEPTDADLLKAEGVLHTSSVDEPTVVGRVARAIAEARKTAEAERDRAFALLLKPKSLRCLADFVERHCDLDKNSGPLIALDLRGRAATIALVEEHHAVAQMFREVADGSKTSDESANRLAKAHVAVIRAMRRFEGSDDLFEQMKKDQVKQERRDG